MTRLLLLIACLLFCATVERVDAQVRFEPSLIQFDHYGCNIDTTLETSLINSGNEPETSKMFGAGGTDLTIVAGPVGWTPGSDLTIGAHDTLRFVLRMKIKPTKGTTASLTFHDRSFTQFVARANWYYTWLALHGSRWTEWKDMHVGETRQVAVMIVNPSNEPRELSYSHIGKTGEWTSAGFSNGFMLQPGDSVQLITSFTAIQPGDNTVTVKIYDGCSTVEHGIKAVVLAPLSVEALSTHVLSIVQRGHSLDFEGYPTGASISLTDLAGRTFFSAEAKETTHKIDLSSLPLGAYLVRISNGVYVETRKIVVGE